MPYPHVTQFETVDLRVSLASRKARPKRVWSRGAPKLTAPHRPAADRAVSA